MEKKNIIKKKLKSILENYMIDNKNEYYMQLNGSSKKLNIRKKKLLAHIVCFVEKLLKLCK